MVASTTRSFSEKNIIATRGEPVSAASRSVCPRHGSPASDQACLLTGAVASAATSPRSASPTARTMASCAARPAAADSSPGRNAAPSGGP